jgi:hypothetical protein
MATAQELTRALDYLEAAGMTVQELRSLHHWSGLPSEKRVTFASTRRYFIKGQALLANNSKFADRLMFVAEGLRPSIAKLVSDALKKNPM